MKILSSSFSSSSSIFIFDYEDEDEDDEDKTFDQISLNAPAKSSGFSAIQREIFSGANQPPHSISSGFN